MARSRKPSTKDAPREIATRRSMERYQRTEGPIWGSFEEITPPLRGPDDDRPPPSAASFRVVTPPPDAPAYANVAFRQVLFEAVEPSCWEGPPGAVRLDQGGFRSAFGTDRHGLTLWCPQGTVVRAKCWRVSELPTLVRRVAPYVDEEHPIFRFPGGRHPPAAALLELARAAGLELVWTDDEGRIVAPFRVPADLAQHRLYEFPPKRLDRAPWAKAVQASERPGLYVLPGFMCEQDDARRLARKLMAALCASPGVRVESGNCSFSGEEWRGFLETGRLPEPPSEEREGTPVLKLRR